MVIEPRAYQVWICDEIGIDPNGQWEIIAYTYKWCDINKIWRTQKGVHPLFWVTLSFFNPTDGQVFIPYHSTPLVGMDVCSRIAYFQPLGGSLYSEWVH